MATIILTAVGSALGGPIGSTIGAIIGQQVDQAIFGSGTREGSRLKELSVTTSSYGQPMARVFGRMRVPGTIIWSTDLIESSEKSGGGKGKPSTKTYSYSASFAVALSSSPISSLGRIWADGELLRGAAGDLKAEGGLRIYNGRGDDPVDPLVAADKGGNAPAFRDCAYVVFENLQLADFGNRIPALTFEIMGEDNASVHLADVVPSADHSSTASSLPHLRGFADEGGPLSSTLSVIGQVFPIACVTDASDLRVAQIENASADVTALPEKLVDREQEEKEHRRVERVGKEPLAMRYYDESRDYQPGVQRAIGGRSNGRERTLDMPGTLLANGARAIANETAQRARWYQEQVSWRMAELDPMVKPGEIVQIPGKLGKWLVRRWEWLDRGVELDLERIPPEFNNTPLEELTFDNAPQDLLPGSTILNVFEVPPDLAASQSDPIILAATSSENSAWRGAALYVEQGQGLIPIASSNRLRSITGHLAQNLAGSSSTYLQAQASLLVQLPAHDLTFTETDISGLALGANRLLVGAEVLQFLEAEPLGGGLWRLSGLLRGRGGTENTAIEGHVAGTSVALIDERLTVLDPSLVQSNAATRIGAIGLGDIDPVFASLQNAGLSRRPLCPVHPRVLEAPDGTWKFCWTRRARGQWLWEDDVDVPLVEEVESYVIGYGPIEEPFATWSVATTQIALSEAERNALLTNHGSGDLWVKQVGTFANSPATLIAQIT